MSESNQRDRGEKTIGYLQALLILGCGLLVIIYLTLKPFSFDFAGATFGRLLSGFVIPPSSFLDFLRNIVLFIPMGFGLGAILDFHGWERKRILAGVICAGFLLTLSVEMLQNFLPDRQPSVSDLFTNTIGALCGYLCFELWQNRREASDRLNESLAVPRSVLVALSVYILFMFLLGIDLASSVRLRDWDPEYKLLLGNERSGDRSWLGTLRDLLIFDRAVGFEEAFDLIDAPENAMRGGSNPLAFYSLSGSNSFVDFVGMQPDLTWRSKTASGGEQYAADFLGEQWLQTESAVSELSARIQDSSEFSIRLSSAASMTEQTGPARIISISKGPNKRNITVGQDGNDLVVRLRSPSAGGNGSAPEIWFPDFFSSSEVIHFVVTFDGLAIRLFDSRSRDVQIVDLLPGVAFHRAIKLISSNYWNVTAGSASIWGYSFLFYLILFFPAGYLVAHPAIRNWSQQYRILLYAGSLLIVPLLLEVALVIQSRQGPRPMNIAAGFIVVALVAWVLMPAIGQLLRFWRAPQPQHGQDTD